MMAQKRSHSSRTSGKKGLASWLGAALLNILAALGGVCIVLVILSFVFNVSIMMFRTGSMSPTITAGSIAFVHEIPAEKMEVGDIITADRGEKVLPVTHRVTSILDTDAQSGEVIFEMKGDANEAKDPEPYTADTVRRVMFSIPGVAPTIQQFRDPFVLGGITIAASLLVVWAFWPRREEDADGDEVAEVAEGTPDNAAAALHQESRSAVTRSPKHAIALPIAALLLATSSGPFPALEPTSSMIAAASTTASDTATTNTAAEARGQYLRMRAVGDESRMLNLSPGASAYWTVDVWADAPEPGTVELEIGSGQLTKAIADELLVDVRACTEIVSMNKCAGGGEELIHQTTLSALGAAPENNRPLLDMPSDEKRRVQVTVTLAQSAHAEAVAGQRSSVRLTAIGQGEEVSLGPGDPDVPGGPDAPDAPGDLPRTGIEGWLWILLLACALIATGSIVIARTRSRRKL
ncbi:signal peptidase I [Brevibacterium aurantiacum]|uniref:Signal peptidase I n=2 Tax=Brevibacterium aurantiacum TaxID=273384 RepID=A0A2H1JXI4_BREAU|nr:signal peptidase I [Brevibacterium aurantiacum]MDN5551329.1 signal peptidase I [Brevibacterium sp.]SMX92173.1 signal peptidase, endoplasmic reticulum-type [Brevibacterium aurantiacum]